MTPVVSPSTTLRLAFALAVASALVAPSVMVWPLAYTPGSACIQSQCSTIACVTGSKRIKSNTTALAGQLGIPSYVLWTATRSPWAMVRCAVNFRLVKKPWLMPLFRKPVPLADEYGLWPT
jgi:hypothetical protein